MIDLWPDDIKALDIKPPVTILKEQGLILSKRTRNVVEGIVDAEPDSSNAFSFAFSIYGPALGYHYKLLTVSYSEEIYPVMINTDAAIIAKVTNSGIKGRTAMTSPTEQVFMKHLKAIFATEKVKRVVAAIIASSLYGMSSDQIW